MAEHLVRHFQFYDVVVKLKTGRSIKLNLDDHSVELPIYGCPRDVNIFIGVDGISGRKQHYVSKRLKTNPNIGLCLFIGLNTGELGVTVTSISLKVVTYGSVDDATAVKIRGIYEPMSVMSYKFKTAIAPTKID